MDNIIHLFGEPPAVEGAPEASSRYGDFQCYPHWPLVDRTSRTVNCKRCKKQLDPIDVLLDVASRAEQWQRAIAETTALRNEVVALKEEEKRVKARTKSHSRKDAEAAVAAERALEQDRRIEVLVRTDEARRALRRVDQLMGKR